MKINKCYIQNFGKLSEYEISFKDNFTSIMQENGFGKTTLTVFIKAMFYGLPQSSKRSIAENERKHYKPWQGGNYGGYIEFEYSGKNLRIERFFGSKESDDSARLIDLSSGKEIDISNKILGEEIFGLDSAGFIRSVFMGQNSTEVSMTDSLNSKLSNLVEDTNDVNNCENAIEAIKKYRKNFATFTGNGGKINEIDKRINDLEFELRQSEGSEVGIRLNNESSKKIVTEIETLEKQEAEIKTEINSAAKQIELLGLAEQYKQICKDVDGLQEKLCEAKSFFKSGIPSDEDISICSQNISECIADQKLLESLKDDGIDSNANDVKDFFSNKVPSAFEIENCKRLIIENKLKTDNLNALSEQNISKSNPIFYILASFFAIAAALTFILIKGLYPSLGSVIGAIFALVFAIIGIVNTAKGKKMIVDLETQKTTLQTDIDNNIKIIRSFTNKYVSEVIDAEEALNTISQKLSEYNQQYQNLEKSNAKIEEISKRISQTKENILLFFGKYNLTPTSNLFSVIDEIKAKKVSIENTEKMILVKKEAAERFYNDNKISEIDVLNRPNIPLLQQELVKIDEQKKILCSRLNLIEAKINSLKENVERNKEIVEEIEDLNVERDSYKLKCELLDKTVEFLKESKENLSKRYLRKMISSFENYSKLFADDLGQFNINTELEVEVEKYGQFKDSEYFSEGYKNIIALCMRFSLCDALYEETEKPFIILDDPFVNFDDNKVKAALKLLEKLSVDRQIIYLSCHSSRI